MLWFRIRTRSSATTPETIVFARANQVDGLRSFESLRARHNPHERLCHSNDKTRRTWQGTVLSASLPQTSKSKMRPTILVIQNAKWEGPGLVAVHARAVGASLATVQLF